MTLFVVDTFTFCHYPTFFGYLLGLFQYLPTILVLSVFFWSLASRDTFFLSLGLALKFGWILALLLKFAILPALVPTAIQDPTPDGCENYIPSILQYVTNLVGGSVSATMSTGSDFPQIDVFQTGIYFGFVMTYLIVWLFPVSNFAMLGLVSLSFVPWSFISAEVNTVLSIGLSFLFGGLIGVLALHLSAKIVLNHDTRPYEDQSKMERACYHFWCGAKSKSGLFFYVIDNQENFVNR